MKNLCYKSRTSLRIGKNLIFSKTNNNPSDIIQKCITKIISTSYTFIGSADWDKGLPHR